MNFKILTLGIVASCTFLACNNDDDNTVSTPTNSEKALALVTAFETGDPSALAYVSNETYIQHNLHFPSGKEAIEGFFTGEATGITVTNHRIFADNDIVVLHNTYGGVWNNNTPQVAFDVFRFENGLIVEHWDNLSDVTPPNPSGRTQTDGTTTITNLEETEANKTLVEGFVTNVLMNGNADVITNYISTETYLQHNSGIADGLDGLANALQFFAENNLQLQYDKLHYIYGSGNFVLTVSEGYFMEGDHVAYYDLFRVEDGKIVEHWDIIETIPPIEEWQNSNGKF